MEEGEAEGRRHLGRPQLALDPREDRLASGLELARRVEVEQLLEQAAGLVLEREAAGDLLARHRVVVRRRREGEVGRPPAPRGAAPRPGRAGRGRPGSERSAGSAAVRWRPVPVRHAGRGPDSGRASAPTTAAGRLPPRRRSAVRPSARPGRRPAPRPARRGRVSFRTSGRAWRTARRSTPAGSTSRAGAAATAWKAASRWRRSGARTTTSARRRVSGDVSMETARRPSASAVRATHPPRPKRSTTTSSGAVVASIRAAIRSAGRAGARRARRSGASSGSAGSTRRMSRRPPSWEGDSPGARARGCRSGGGASGAPAVRTTARRARPSPPRRPRRG